MGWVGAVLADTPAEVQGCRQASQGVRPKAPSESLDLPGCTRAAQSLSGPAAQVGAGVGAAAAAAAGVGAAAAGGVGAAAGAPGCWPTAPGAAAAVAAAVAAIVVMAAAAAVAVVAAAAAGMTVAAVAAAAAGRGSGCRSGNTQPPHGTALTPGCPQRRAKQTYGCSS